MIFPQHAPYTDPLRIIVCGGSTPGPAQVLDNCVHIAPEDTNPQWTIERMASAPVISPQGSVSCSYLFLSHLVVSCLAWLLFPMVRS